MEKNSQHDFKNKTLIQNLENFYQQHQLLFRVIFVAFSFYAFDILYFYQLGIGFNAIRGVLLFVYALFISSITFSKKYWKTSLTIFAVVFLVVSLIYFGEAAYYRVFGQFVTVKDINRVNELQGLGNSVLSYFRKSDILYLFPWVTFLIVTLFTNRKLGRNEIANKKKTEKLRERLPKQLSLSLLSLAIILGVHFVSVGIFEDTNKRFVLNTTQYATNYGVLDMISNQGKRLLFGGDNKLSEEGFYAEFGYEQKQNEYSGIYEGKNLVFITAESVSTKAIDPNISPVMHRLSNEGLYFENYHSTRPSTPNSEYAMLNSFYLTGDKEKEGYTSTGSLPGMLKEKGYSTHAYHSFFKDVYDRNVHYPEFGFDTFHDVNDLSIPAKGDWLDFPRDDLLFERSFPVFENDKQFFNYYLTVSPHGPFKDRETLQDMLPAIEEKFPNASTELQAYYAGVSITDLGIDVLMKGLEERGILENTVIVIVGDHYPYTLSDEAQREIGFNDDLDTAKVPFIIWDASKLGVKKDELAVNVDILPTLSNMFNLDLEFAMGIDLLSSDGTQSLGEWHDFRDFSIITNNGGYDAKHNQETGDIDKNQLQNETFIRYQLNELELEIKKR